MNENGKLVNKNERIEKIPIIGSIINFIIFAILTFIPYFPAYFGLTDWWKNMGTKKYIYAWIITYSVSLILQVYSLFYEANRDKDWERQNEKDIEKFTERFRKELLETKTELLLTQNKLRKLQEKN